MTNGTEPNGTEPGSTEPTETSAATPAAQTSASPEAASAPNATVYTAGAAPAPEAGPPTPGETSLRILLIEDDAPLAEALMAFLNARGFVCECAASLADARALLPAAHWAAVLPRCWHGRWSAMSIPRWKRSANCR